MYFCTEEDAGKLSLQLRLFDSAYIYYEEFTMTQEQS